MSSHELTHAVGDRGRETWSHRLADKLFYNDHKQNVYTATNLTK